MKFWAIAYKYQEDVFFDFAKEEDDISLEPTCLLPTKELAEQYIEDELSRDYVPVEIDLERLEKNGTWTYSIGRVAEWDEEC